MIGLKRGTVQLCEHKKEWEIEAQNTIARLKEILGDVIKDIQHVGSTSCLLYTSNAGTCDIMKPPQMSRKSERSAS